MTVSNIIELVILLCSIPAVIGIVRRSNRAVSDIDGLGEVVKKGHETGTVIAHI